MQVVKISQRSEEWHQWREDKLTGTKLKDIYSSRKLTSEKDGFYKLVANQVARPITLNDYVDENGEVAKSLMDRGAILEPQIIARLLPKYPTLVAGDGEVWVSDDCPQITVSPDAYLSGKKITEAFEFKCPDSHRVVRAKAEGTYPREYHLQALQYFIVNESLEKLHFIIYTDVIPGLEIQEFVINRADIEDEIEPMKAYELDVIKRVNALAEELAF